MRYPRAIAALASVLLAGVVWAADLKLPAEVKGEPADFITVPAETNGKDVKWVALDVGLKVFPSSLLKDSKTAVVTAQKPGKYRLLAYTSDEKGPSEPAITTVVVAGVEPPTPPVPPVPPTPPTPPTPPVPPAPIPVAGLRVLIVEEAMDRAKLPAAQAAIIFDARVREYLNTKCVVGPDGRTREWNIFDQNVYTGDTSKLWQDAMKRKRDSLPWILISDGKTGYEGPLPPTVEDTLNLLKKYGG